MAARILAPRGFGFVQAPLFARQVTACETPASFSEILLAQGWGDEHALSGCLRAWSGLFDLSRPDLLVADHAPCALAAARCASLPALALGSSFEIPPAVSPLPSIRPWDEIAEARLQSSEERVLDVLARVARPIGSLEISGLQDLFENAVLTTYPELDHYKFRPSGNYLGAWFPSDGLPAIEWPVGNGSRLFAYLPPDSPGFTDVVMAVSRFACVAITVAPGLPLAEASRFTTKSHRVVPYPIKINDLLDQANAVIGCAGAGIITQSLLAGKPLLSLPKTVEQRLGADRVEALGAGLTVGEERKVGDILPRIGQVLTDTGVIASARRFSESYRAMSLTSVHRAGDAIEGLLLTAAA